MEDVKEFGRGPVLLHALKEFGLDDDEAMLYYQIQQVAKNATLIDELRVGERAAYIADFQRILERILARRGLRALGHSPKVGDAGTQRSEGKKGDEV